MNHADFELQALSDPRLAVHAVGSLPAWLWSADGSRVLWANAMAARALGAANSWALVDAKLRYPWANARFDMAIVKSHYKRRRVNAYKNQEDRTLPGA
ncbi:hypothetical protein, partial [Bradyrhizobium sp.]|uniref:hypothetical protein n=1 Tax=Bradyrhizobium sp. TaxID=376 RepID=UPI00391B2A25